MIRQQARVVAELYIAALSRPEDVRATGDRTAGPQAYEAIRRELAEAAGGGTRVGPGCTC